MRDLIARIRGRVFVWRCRHLRRNISIGAGLRMYCGLEIRGDGQVVLGNNCVVSGIRADSAGYVSIYTHDPRARVLIGNNAMLYATRITCEHGITIGDDFRVEDAALMDSDSHSITPDRAHPVEIPEKCRITIGKRVSVGARSIICKGVEIGDDVQVFPGTIITKNVPPGTRVYGNPGRPYRANVCSPLST